jgi:hypothetical protein
LTLRFITVLAILYLLLQAAPAQEQVELSPEVAASHLLKTVDPVYPAFARAAGVEGVVHIRVGINQYGRIGTIAERKGPPSLFKAAEDAVAQNVYRPFEKDSKPVYVQTTINVAFWLPSHKTPLPPPHLSRSNFWGDEGHRPMTELSPEIRTWLITHAPPDRDGVCDDAASDCASSRLVPAHEDVFKDVEVFELPAPVGSRKLYLVGWHVDCGATGNCPEEVLEQKSVGIRSMLTTYGSGYYAYQRPGAPYPDIFIASHASAREVGIAGYVSADGEWGQLYCGEILIKDDESETETVGFTCLE